MSDKKTGAGAGELLGKRLGLPVLRREGHDLVGACIACPSSDAFRLHAEDGVAYCYSCSGKWSPFDLATTVLKDRGQAESLLVDLGLFEPRANAPGRSKHSDPIAEVARQKRVPAESLKRFGAKAASPAAIQMPAYGPNGVQCTTFTLTVQGGKGLLAKGKNAGLFFPHTDGKVRLPQPGETWHLVEGVKDAAALDGLGLLACGLNTSRLASKFARLFRGFDVILIPDRDRAGESGSIDSACALRGVATVRIAVLPAEFKESDGLDVRDILRRPGGREQILQAISDAKPPDGWETQSTSDGNEADSVASAEFPLPEGELLRLTVAPAHGKSARLVVAKWGDLVHRDRFNTDNNAARRQFIKALALKLNIERGRLSSLIDSSMTTLADKADALVKQPIAFAGAEKDGSQATLVANIAFEWDLWRTPGQIAYATIPVGGHLETWPIDSQTFKRFLSGRFYQGRQTALNSTALSSALSLIEAKAQFEGEVHPVYLRVAEFGPNIYIDLCDADWRVVEVAPDGWRVLDKSPVRFQRSKGMLPLPVPEPGGSIDLLRQFLHVDDDTWRLIVGWLVNALRPRGPYPVLALFAEQGSGKSTLARMLRALVDPNTAPLRSEPLNDRDLMISSQNSWCQVFDNLSHISQRLSDAFCRLSTGGGYATRELFTNQDEVIFDSQRPVILTSIDDVAGRSDLLDRCLMVQLQMIPPNGRRPEADLLSLFEQLRPKILGALLTAVSTALQNLASTKLSELPRMADFALWVTAAEPAVGWAPGAFMEAYQGNRVSANDLAIEANPIAGPLVRYLDDHGSWSGTSTELLDELERVATERDKRHPKWPKCGRSVSGHLRRLAPNLRAIGWQVIDHRNSHCRNWIIRRDDAPAEPDQSLESENLDANWR